jgi:hypothetical protein
LQRIKAIVPVSTMRTRVVASERRGRGTRPLFDVATGALHAGTGVELRDADIGVLDGRLIALTVVHDRAVPTSLIPPIATVWDVASGEPWRVPEERAEACKLVTADGRLVAVVADDAAAELPGHSQDSRERHVPRW